VASDEIEQAVARGTLDERGERVQERREALLTARIELAEALDSAFLREVLAEELYYDGIVGVLPAERARTFDIEVEELHNFVADDVVVHNCAPPFKQAEFDIIYGDGISWEGSVLDVGLERKLVQKSGSYFSYGDERLGQGRQNATAFLREHPDVTEGILRAVQSEIGPEGVASSRLLPVGDTTEKKEAKEPAEVASSRA
jgi:recombination protein RecA